MRIIVFDAEVFQYDFFLGFKDVDTEEYFDFHNDGRGIDAFIRANRDALFCGFNSKGYDRFVVGAMVNTNDPQTVFSVSDFIIRDHNGWEYPDREVIKYWFPQFDLMDDTQDGTSLKSFEAHYGLNIRETEIDFTINRPLTPDECDEVVHYNHADLDATEALLKERKDYLQTKINLGRRIGLDPSESLVCTNAKLTAKLLHAERHEYTDGRNYQFPANLDTSDIPSEIITFFNTIHDENIPDSVLFKTQLQITLGGMPCVYAWGGVHGSMTCYYAEADDEWYIGNKDVSSLYPSLLVLYHYLSRSIPDPQIFIDLRDERLLAKANGDKQTAKDLKLPLNTVSGAQENRYNDLYDPLPTRSMRISGQLFLTVLLMRFLAECPSFKPINFNTDGLMFKVKRSELATVERIADEWMKETGLELETDEIQRVWIKDVNNLLIEMTDGHKKTVGGYLNYGINTKGAFSINNNYTIVKDALKAFLLDGTPVEETIENCYDPLKFQIIAKAGGSYRGTYHIVNGEPVQVQKVNRVYATKDTSFGTLCKLHKSKENLDKIANLPEHCIVDNANEITPDLIDKEWYCNLARKMIADFIGGNTRKMQKLEKEILKILEDK